MPSVTPWLFLSGLATPPENIDHAGAAGAAHVVGQPQLQIGIGYLARSGFAPKLMEDFSNLSDARGAHRMSFGFEPSRGVDG